jgi:tetratricopeptide (TPR) repeat protein
MWTETQPPLSLGQFEIVADKCGFDDVLRHYDPMLIGGLRHNIAAHQDFDARTRRHVVLFSQPGRQELCQRMGWTGCGSYAAWQTRLYARVLTSPYASYYLQATRYIPGAHASLMRFVRHIDEGRLNALSPAIAGSTIAFLEWSEVPRERSWFGYTAAAIVILLVIADLRKLFAPPPPRPSIDVTVPTKQDANSRALLALVQRGASMHRQADKSLADGKKLEAVQTYDEIITMFRDDKRGDLALAHYNKGWLLSDLGRDLEARDIYEFVWKTFWNSKHKEVKPLVAMSQVNLGHVYRRTGRHPDSVAAYVRAYSMYGDDQDVRLRAQGAKSRFALAEYYSMTGKRDDARRLAASVSERYKNDTDSRITHYVTAAQALLVGLNAPR